MNLFNIPVARPFFSTFVSELLKGNIIPAIQADCDPLLLSDLTILVPTRRAARALAQVFSTQLSPKPVILPKIVPLGDPADLHENGLFSEEYFAGITQLLPAIAPLSRQLHLMRLIEGWRQAIQANVAEGAQKERLFLRPGDLFQVASSPADAFGLATDLAGLMDEMTIEGIDWNKLKNLAPDHDEYWNFTLKFLDIASQSWPDWLKEQGLMDEAARRLSLIQMETQRLLTDRPSSSLIVAGSTGSQPVTAALMVAIAALPNGAVILPGLDRHLSDADWAKITSRTQDMAQMLTSPQATLKRLLNLRMERDRDDVQDLGCDIVDWVEPRRMLVAETLRPADTTEHWASSSGPATEHKLALACEDLTVIETVDEREEALAIALVLRKALAIEDKHIAFVTPDRALAARVSAELERFDLNVSDSAGKPLSGEPAGVLARLALDVAVSHFEPRAVLALLYHPLVHLGQNRQLLETAIAALDIGVMRQSLAIYSIGSHWLITLREAIQKTAAPQSTHKLAAAQRRLAESLLSLCMPLIDKLEAALSPLTLALAHKDTSLSELAQLHEAALSCLTRDENNVDHQFDHADGAALAQVLEALKADGAMISDIRFTHTYPALLDSLARAETVRHVTLSHPRLHIWGQLEARLLDVDLVVLGGLNEGSWPPTVSTDAFLNRPMRAAIGLSPPERRIGQSAHDFAMLMGMKEVVLTRSNRQQDQPTIASRFLRRLEAYIGQEAFAGLRQKGDAYVKLARYFDDAYSGDHIPENEQSLAARPEPKPAIELRPTRLSITEIETLYRDPYAIFAKHVLRLDALNERLLKPSASERGTLVHNILAEFIASYSSSMPQNALDILLNIAREQFKPFNHHLDVQTFWWSRFEKTAIWFVENFELHRQLGGMKPLVELGGALEFKLADGSSFTLSCRADRIDLNLDGSFSVIDYKTGTVPSQKEVQAGFNPQLTLEAAMVQAGGFQEVAAQRSLSEMLYVKLLGNAKEPGRVTIIKPEDKEQSLDDLAQEHFIKLKSHLLRYRQPSKGYISRFAPKKLSYISPYDHLARVKEWTNIHDDENGDGEEA